MSPSAESLRHQRSNSLGDRLDGEAALAAARARGQVRVPHCSALQRSVSPVCVGCLLLQCCISHHHRWRWRHCLPAGGAGSCIACPHTAPQTVDLKTRPPVPHPLYRADVLPQVLVTAGYTGEIKVYENIGLPQWL